MQKGGPWSRTHACVVRSAFCFAGRAARAALRPVAVAVPRKRLAAPLSSAATASAVTATEQAVGEVAIANGVHILTADTYHGFLEKNAEKLVVTDFYAVW